LANGVLLAQASNTSASSRWLRSYVLGDRGALRVGSTGQYVSNALRAVGCVRSVLYPMRHSVRNAMLARPLRKWPSDLPDNPGPIVRGHALCLPTYGRHVRLFSCTPWSYTHTKRLPVLPKVKSGFDWFTEMCTQCPSLLSQDKVRSSRDAFQVMEGASQGGSGLLPLALRALSQGEGCRRSECQDLGSAFAGFQAAGGANTILGID